MPKPIFPINILLLLPDHMPKDFLLEIHCEEIPAKFLAPLHLELQAKVIELLTQKGLINYQKDLTSPDWYSPRKIAVFFPDILEIQPDIQVSEIGPSKAICFDSEGQPTEAALRFVNKWKSDFQELVFEEVKGKKGEYAVLHKTVKGLSAIQVLSESLPGLIASLAVPKAMRWGHSSFVFVRPIRNIVCLLGSSVVPFEVDGVPSASTTQGHRLSPGEIRITQPKDYESNLAKHQIIVSFENRRMRLLRDLSDAASSIQGILIQDEALLRTVSEIVEYPSVVLGQFPPEFLNLPKSVLMCSLREHQKAFCIQNNEGKLLPYFLSVANRDLSRETKARQTITHGNQWVLNARLFDAQFFYNQDTQTSLEAKRSRLEELAFIRGAGTYLQKTQRLVLLADYLAPHFNLKENEFRFAVSMSKLDLTTQMVGEFPELQGQVGAEYLRKEGVSETICKAVEEHYAPIAADAPLPKTPLGALLAVVDKVDTLVAAFAVGQTPTGSKDPLGLRRAGLGLVRILRHHKIGLSPQEVIHESLLIFSRQFPIKEPQSIEQDLRVFWEERIAFSMLQDGLNIQLIRSVMGAPWHNHLQLLMRCASLKRAMDLNDFSTLIDNAKRINNILIGQVIEGDPSDNLLTSPSEKKLLQKMRAIDGLMHQDKLDIFCSSLAELAQPLEDFFKEVMVLDEDLKIRHQRLHLLAQLKSQFSYIADFTKW